MQRTFRYILSSICHSIYFIARSHFTTAVLADTVIKSPQNTHLLQVKCGFSVIFSLFRLYLRAMKQHLVTYICLMFKTNYKAHLYLNNIQAVVMHKFSFGVKCRAICWLRYSASLPTWKKRPEPQVCIQLSPRKYIPSIAVVPRL